MRGYVIELVGTFVLVLTAAVTFAFAEPLAPVAVGAVLGAFVAAGAGGPLPHLNPAVSLGAALRGRIDFADLLPYWAAQLLGGLAAAALALWLVEVPAGTEVTGGQLLRAGTLELVLALALTFVTLASENGLAAGAMMAGGLVVASTVTAGALNPAIAFGQAVSGLTTWTTGAVVVVATLGGGALAGLLPGPHSSRPG